MILAGVSVRNELVQRLGYLVGDTELAGKIAGTGRATGDPAADGT